MRLYFPGQWTYIESDGSTRRLDVSIRTRGNFRRELCSLPPLQLNYKKKQVRETLFEGQDKLKLVGRCESHDSYAQLLQLEYLAYKVFEVVSEHHFRTRLLQLSYVDSDAKKKPRTDISFLIEDENDMATRYAMEYLEVPYVMPEQLDLAQTAVVEMFQPMIGNTDYSTIRGPKGAECCHNVKLITVENSDGGIIPVPYDFDTSGLVNAGYSVPPAALPIRSVRTRYFTGRCKEERHWENTIALFNDKKNDVMSLFLEAEHLDDRTRERTLEYLEEFYELINDARRINKEIFGRCRGDIVRG